LEGADAQVDRVLIRIIQEMNHHAEKIPQAAGGLRSIPTKPAAIGDGQDIPTIIPHGNNER
jgi:hypothetical protein